MASPVDLSARPYDMTGKRVLVTGAFGGIGRATATLLANLGAELVLSDRADAADFRAGLKGSGHRFVPCDVT